MKRVVVDASVALKWVVEEHDSKQALALLKEWSADKAEILAPVLLVYEITNTLYRRVRDGKLPPEDTRKGLEKSIFTTISFLWLEDANLSLRAMQLAHQFGFPAAYDTQYLALAEHTECEFWTADTRIWKAVKEQLPWVRCLADYEPSHTRA